MGKAPHLVKNLLVTTCLFLLSSLALAAEEDFPAPEIIKPAIKFWTRVYTEVDTNSGFLHDAENLSIIYARLPRDADVVKQQRARIVADLKILASGKRSNLTDLQQDILELWTPQVSSAELGRAVDRVRWQLGQSDRFQAGLIRSGAYRKHIEAVIRAKQMPLELAVLPHVESSFNPGAYSSAAATGMWQFIRATAQRFMQVDHVVDERLDPYAATNGAMELLEYNYNALGTWPLALTAYNHGANGMARAVKAMGTNDIGKIISEYKGSRFGFASRNFYPQFLAVLEVERRADEFFGPLQPDPHPEFIEYELAAYVEARTLAENLGIAFEDLKRANPALQPSVWSGSKRIPRGYKVKVDRANYNGDLASSISRIPGSQLYSQQIPDLSYAVRSGDSLSLIADRYNTTISALVSINQLRDRHRIRIGQTLLLPQPEGSAATLLARNETPGMPASGRYEVRSGDTLSIISNRFKVPEETLLALNSLENRNLIYPGQTLSLTSSVTAAQDAPVEQVASVPQLASLEPVAAVSSELDQVLDDIEEGVEAQTPQQDGGPARAAEPQLASLSVDSGNTALAVDEAIVQAEAEEQLQVDLSADPSDYSVAGNNSIEIQEAETLGHYAEWLGIRAWDLRRLNNLTYGQHVISGRRLKLDFSQVDVASFERRRQEYHRDLQAHYFEQWRIKSTEKYTIQRRDLLVNLVNRRSVPMWLFRQYNPDVDSSRMQIGQEIVIPVVEKVES